MQHEAHVGLVDAHAEGDGGADDDAVLLQEGVLIGRAHGGLQPRVIGQSAAAALGKFLREFLGAPARGAIDHPALAGMAL